MYKEKYPDIRTARKYKRNKRLRYLKYQRHLRQLWTITRHHSIFPPVEYVNKIYVHGHFCERKIPYYRRYSENHGGIGRRFCKKLSNRRIRHYKKGISKGGNYKKYMIINGRLSNSAIVYLKMLDKSGL